MEYLKLREIQMEMLKIFKKFIQICDENNIEYQVMGGTLIGTIRHKGFIPWDDDIDLFMAKPEYNKLIDLIKQHKFDDLEYKFIGGPLGDHTHPFLKMINPKIKIHEKEEVDKYLWIDIFPMEAVSNDEEVRNKELKKLFIKEQVLDVKLMSWKGVFKSSKTIPRKVAKIMVKPFTYFINFDKYMDTLLKEVGKYDFNNSKYISSSSWLDPRQTIYDKSWFEKYELRDFEDIKVKVPTEYDKYLTTCFGNYMELPPENKRYTHSFDAWFEE